MRNALLALGVALLTSQLACAKQGAPEQVSDAFVDAYFRHADQEKAKEYTALGVTEMLDRELSEVAKLRRDGYTPDEGGGIDIEVRRGTSSTRDQRVRVPYQVIVKSSAGDSVRDADVELANIRGTWKVVRLGLNQR